MRWLPNQPLARLRLALLATVLIVLAWRVYGRSWLAYRAYSPQDGDIVFQSLPHPPGRDLVDAIEGCTRSPLSHTGVVLRDPEGWMVYEAIGPSQRTPLLAWIRRGRGGNLLAYRLRHPPDTLADSLRRIMEPLLGRPYDTRYEPGDDALYCSEFVHLAFERGARIHLADWQTFGSLVWKPWEDIARRYNDGDPPLDRWMITPVALARSPRLQPVYATPGYHP